MVQGGLSRNVLVGGCVFFDVCDVWEGHFGVSIDGGTTCGYLRVVCKCKIFWHFSVLFFATTQNFKKGDPKSPTGRTLPF